MAGVEKSSAAQGLCALVVLATLAAGYAETSVCGPITSDSVWSPKGNPYVVTCVVVIAKGARLTIEPGVEVRFKKRVHLKVDGGLVAQGTEVLPILFTSSAETPYPGDWGGIVFSPDSEPAIFDETGRYRDGSVLRYTVLQFAGSSGRTGVVEMYEHAPYLEHVIIRKNAASALYSLKGTLRVKSSSFMQNSNSQAFGGGILAFSSTLVLEDTAIGKNPTSGSGGGIHAATSSITLRNCTLYENETSSNGGALFAADSTVSIEGCLFLQNGTALRGGAVYASRSTVQIKNSIFRENATVKAATFGAPSGAGVLAQGAAIFVTDSRLAITDSTFVRNRATTDCAALSAEGSALILTGTNFIENVSAGDGAALCLDNIQPGSAITGSTIVLNRSEKRLRPNVIYIRSGQSPVFRQNNILQNTGYDLLNDTAHSIQAAENWWGTLNDAEVQARIYDRTQDANKGEVLFHPLVQTGPVPAGGHAVHP